MSINICSRQALEKFSPHMTKDERIYWKLFLFDIGVMFPWLCQDCPACDCYLPDQLTLKDAYWRDGEE